MIRLSKETPESTEILVFDVRDKAIAKATNREPKVYLGKIIPINRGFRWESAWGGNTGEAATEDRCMHWIQVCAKGQYR
jgi:hypothetical protein